MEPLVYLVVVVVVVVVVWSYIRYISSCNSKGLGETYFLFQAIAYTIEIQKDRSFNSKLVNYFYWFYEKHLKQYLRLFKKTTFKN